MPRHSPRPAPDDDRTRRRLRDRVARLEREVDRLRGEAERRKEDADRVARIARDLVTALDIDELLERIAVASQAVVRADGAYVEVVDRSGETVEVAAVAGRGHPPSGTRVPYPGSLAERAIQTRRTEIVPDLAERDRPIRDVLRRTCGRCTGLVAPLVSAEDALGALVVLRRAGSPDFAAEDTDRVRTLTDLAIVSLRRVRLLDETDHRRRTVEASEQRLRTTLEALPIGVWFTDEEGTLVYGNPAARRIWGGARYVAPDQFGEYKGWRLDTGERIRAEDWGLARTLRTGRPSLDEEVEIETFDGTHKIMRNSAVPLRDAHGRITGALVLNEDITQRKRAEMEREQARAEAERRAREEAALRRATSAVAGAFTVEAVVERIAGSALTATDADSAVVERVDTAKDETKVVAVAGAHTLSLGERVPYTGSLAERVVETGESVTVHDIVEDAGVSERLSRAYPHGTVLALPMIDGGEPLGALLLLRRPDRRPFSEDEIDRANTFASLASLAFRKVFLLDEAERRRRDLERVLESQSRLVRGFSHDVKNPLGAADGRLSLLEEGMLDGLSERQRKNLGRARRSISTAIRLIDSLVDFARAEAGQIEVRRVDVDVRGIAREIAEEYRPAAEQKGLAVNVALPDRLAPIRSDPDRIRQILGNLMSNAVKYTGEGGIRVRVLERKDRNAPGPGRWVCVEVSDTGPGIPEGEREVVFEEFKRGAAGESGAGGAGLGLAISRRLALLLGGEITLESEPGRGSTFTLWLPMDATGERRGGPAA